MTASDASPHAMPKIESIRRRLTRRLLLRLIAFAVVVNALLYLYLREELIEEYDESLSTQALAVVSLLQSEADSADLSSLVVRSFPQLRLQTDERDCLQVWRADGSVVLRSRSLGDHALERPTQPSPPDHVRIESIQLPDGDGGRAAAIRFPESAGPQTAGWTLLLAESTTELDDTLMSLAIGQMLISGGMGLLAVWFIVYGVRRELRPLEDFADAVGELRVDTLGFRFDAATMPEELAPIARRMNELLVRLGSAFERERRFSGNLAHELRTPMAEMRTMLEVASRWPPDAEGIARLHHDLLVVTLRTSSLLEALLTIVRHQQGHQSIEIGLVPLRACVLEAWESTTKLASDRQVRLKLCIAEELAVRANHTVLVALLTNLLENAASYGTPASEILVEAAVDARRTLLRITNHTSDLDPTDLPRLQEPFWRKDAARVDRAHTGLGLALVREYAAAMHIDLALSMPQSDRLAVTLTWKT